jgi:AcrR family transcriptional regulator
VTGRRGVRDNLTTAAIGLFRTNGYDGTTVDAIAEAAGVARRTFFRYFRTKEDAVFPDHDECLRRVELLLHDGDAGAPALLAIRAAAHLVLAMYADDPATAVQRYELTRHVVPLRERELTATSRYQRVFTEHLRHRRGAGEPGGLRDEVIAAAVVAAHNHVLRQWLREGGTADAHARLDAALDAVEARLGPWLAGRPPAGRDEDVMVVAVRRGTPIWRIVQTLEPHVDHGVVHPDLTE